MLRHPGHDHWHFDAMAAYALCRPDSPRSRVPQGELLPARQRRVDGVTTTVRREHFGECEPPGCRASRPVGSTSMARTSTASGWRCLRVDDEVVCLDLEADPRGLVEEADEADNATSVAVRVAGHRFAGLPPVCT